MPTELLIDPANGVPASVTPRCSGYGTFEASRRYARIMVGTWLDFTEILKSRKSEALEQPHLLERGLDQSLGLVALRKLVQVLRQRAGVRADAHRDPRGLRGAHDLRDLVRAADVAGVDPDCRDAGVDRLQGEARVEVDVGDHGDRREADDPAERLGVLVLRDGDADDLAAGGGERGDLGGRGLDVVRLRQRHRLDDDGGAAADLDSADRDVALGSHLDASVSPPFTGSCGSAPPSRGYPPPRRLMSFERPMNISTRKRAMPIAETRS